MNNFPETIRFKKSWRSYQARVLEELEDKLDDNRLHIIAPPGSGKTVLGLEVMRRLNKPAVVLAPTLAIRDQWVERFLDLFADNREDINWISKDINHPDFITVTTYQSLHSAMSGCMEEDTVTEELEEAEGLEDKETSVRLNSSKATEIIGMLKSLGVVTLVVDEAHHLRSEWWKSLIYLKDNLSNPYIVALTATPPYDSSPSEWEKYSSLCGEIDAEIFVPELVKCGDLCPHQDYIYFSSPSAEEAAAIVNFRNAVSSFIGELNKNQEFITAIKSHPCLTDPEKAVETILEKPSYYSSMAIFLKHVGTTGYEPMLRVMGVDKEIMPRLTPEWLEILLTGFLYEDVQSTEIYEPLIKEIKYNLGSIGAVERKKVNLRTTESIKKLLLSSITKLNSIERVVKIENEVLGKDLRMVILTDYIRGSEMPKDRENVKPLNKIGVVPIFELLRRTDNTDLKLGILSGSLVVLPASSYKALVSIAEERMIGEDKLLATSLKHDENYYTLNIKGQDAQHLVQIVTQLFTLGEITVMIGTKSLLGEGWDAPCINSLILASFVGSYMLSNQMRGRAIRVWPNNPKKTANIWHLICIEQGQQWSNYDFELLTRRFKAFVGVSFEGPSIENGIDRFSLPEPPYSRAVIDELNSKMTGEAKNRESLLKKWKTAIEGNGIMSLKDEIRCQPELLPSNFIFTKTVKALIFEGLLVGLSVFSGLLEGISANGKGILRLVAVAAGIAALFALPSFIKAVWLYLKYGPVELCMKQIGEALLKSLIFSGNIKSKSSHLKVKVDKFQFGFVSCQLKGGTPYETSIFLKAFEELLGPVENPRYLLIRKSKLGIIQRKDYHSVPSLIGTNEKNASHFLNMWEKCVGPSMLIYTRSQEGRKILLNARVKSMASTFQKRSDRVTCWK